MSRKVSVWLRVNHYPVTPAGEDMTLCLILSEWENLSSGTRSEFLSGNAEDAWTTTWWGYDEVCLCHTSTERILLWWRQILSSSAAGNKCLIIKPYERSQRKEKGNLWNTWRALITVNFYESYTKHLQLNAICIVSLLYACHDPCFTESAAYLFSFFYKERPSVMR